MKTFFMCLETFFKSTSKHDVDLNKFMVSDELLWGELNYGYVINFIPCKIYSIEIPFPFPSFPFP